MSSVANVDFDNILKEIAKALYKNSDIDDLGKALGFGPGEIGRKIAENDKQGGNYMGTLDLLRMWRYRQTRSTEKAALRSALVKARFDNLADQYLSTLVTGKRFFVFNGSTMRFVQKKRESNLQKKLTYFSLLKSSKADHGHDSGAV